MLTWEAWFAWRPVNLAHGYANCQATAWLTTVMRAKVDGRWRYALPGWEAQC